MATTERERLTLLLFYGYVLALAFLAFQILRPFLTPLPSPPRRGRLPRLSVTS